MTDEEGACISAVYEGRHELMYLGPKIRHVAHPDHFNDHQQSSCNGHGHSEQLWIHKQGWREQA